MGIRDHRKIYHGSGIARLRVGATNVEERDNNIESNVHVYFATLLTEGDEFTEGVVDPISQLLTSRAQRI